MKNKAIDQILEKYFTGESSLQEEKQLKSYFNHEEYGKEYDEIAPIFQYFQKAEHHQLDEAFDEKILASISKSTQRKGQIRWMKYSAIAASIAVVLSLGIWYINDININTNTATAINWDEYLVEDEAEAIAQLQFALSKTSNAINKGTTSAMENIQKERKELQSILDISN